MKAPFNFGKLVVGGQFINRQKEIENLEINFTSHINTILISPRRWGKSSLVNQVANRIQQNDKKIKFCFIDLFSIRNEAEFYQVFATEVLKATSTKWEEWINNGKKFISGLIPRFNVGINPTTDFSVSFDWEELKKEGSEILNLPEIISKEKNIHIVICIDEFQNIDYFEDSLGMQKKMRASWQKQQITTYCLYGSKRHMLTELFENKSMPFYKFGDTIFLDKIKNNYWEEYIVNQFASTKKEISNNLAISIASRMSNHPYFVQLYSSTVWKLTIKKCSIAILDEALDELKSQYSIMYQRELDNLTNKQVNFLVAMANEIEHFSSQKNLIKYNLGAQSNIKRLKTTLENKEIIDSWGTRLEFTDPLFKIWFIQDYLKK